MGCFDTSCSSRVNDRLQRGREREGERLRVSREKTGGCYFNRVKSVQVVSYVMIIDVISHAAIRNE